MADFDTVFNALRCCATDQKCKGCTRDECKKIEQTKTDVPVTLLLDVLELLITQHNEIDEHKRREKVLTDVIYCEKLFSLLFEKNPELFDKDRFKGVTEWTNEAINTMRREWALSNEERDFLSAYCPSCGARMENSEKEPVVNLWDHPDPVRTIRAALVCTTMDRPYSIGFRNGLRYSIAVLTGEEPKYETVNAEQEECEDEKRVPERPVNMQHTHR